MIDLTQHGDIAILRMAHGKANALDVEFCNALAEAFGKLKEGAARAVVLTATGSIFSAGVDLLRVSAGGEGYVRQLLPALHQLYDAAFNLPKPLVAAVNGHAIAGGCVLACCADVRIAARGNARIGVTELLVGVPFPAMAFEVMRFAASPQDFPEMILSGATYPGDDARARGLLDEVVEPAELMDRATARAKALAALSPAAFAATKQQIRQPVADRIVQHGKRVDDRAGQIWAAADTLEHIRDYVAKTFKKA
jgi:enoyl-CoA hydratase